MNENSNKCGRKLKKSKESNEVNDEQTKSNSNRPVKLNR